MNIKPNFTKIISSVLIVGLLSLVIYEGKAKADLESSLKDNLVSTGKFIYNDENGNQVVLDAEDLRTLADTIDENKNTSDQQIDELNNNLSKNWSLGDSAGDIDNSGYIAPCDGYAYIVNGNYAGETVLIINDKWLTTLHTSNDSAVIVVKKGFKIEKHTTNAGALRFYPFQ